MVPRSAHLIGQGRLAGRSLYVSSDGKAVGGRTIVDTIALPISWRSAQASLHIRFSYQNITDEAPITRPSSGERNLRPREVPVSALPPRSLICRIQRARLSAWRGELRYLGPRATATPGRLVALGQPTLAPGPLCSITSP